MIEAYNLYFQSKDGLSNGVWYNAKRLPYTNQEYVESLARQVNEINPDIIWEARRDKS